MPTNDRLESHLLHGGVEELQREKVRSALGRVAHEKLAYGVAPLAHPHASKHARNGTGRDEGQQDCCAVGVITIDYIRGGGR